MRILVTLSGECFGVEYIDAGHDGRDGTLFYFRLKDLCKGHGLRNVSLFLPLADRVFAEDYDARIETVRLNALRRAFDSGTFSFDAPAIPDRYYELQLRATDFLPQKKASDEAIRCLIKVRAYWLGSKYCPDAPNPFVDFHCVEDLEYLGARSQDIRRNVRLLTEEDYLRSSSAATLGSPPRVLPTSKLIREFEGGDEPRPPLFAAKEPVEHNEGSRQTPAKVSGLDTVTSEPKPLLRVFLSHSRVDKDAVRQLYKRLVSDGFGPWFDEENLIPGQDWEAAIKRAVQNSDAVIVCLSKTSVARPGYAQREIKLALDVADEQPEGTIYLIPLKLEECEILERLKRLQWVELYQAAGYQNLLKALRSRSLDLGIPVSDDSEQGRG